jgi:heterodisulfide reductase subunit A-like polyferredoxin
MNDNQAHANAAGNGKDAPVGAVLVCGGGIAGMQAALDLSAAGFRVHLAESAPNIGGAMAKLDKTFPTGDCATCILSPKLVACARDINIDLHTLTEIEAVRGEAGHFTVTLKRKPRFIVESECNGCGDCVAACPVELRGLLDCRLGAHKAIGKPSAQAVPNVVRIEKQQRPPCRMACPLGQNAQGYIALLRAGKYAEAVSLIRETNPFPSICGYVCHHPCESACERGRIDDPVAIRALKRFAIEKAAEMGIAPAPPTIEPRAEKIAIIGAGPAGLAAADRLAREGFRVTIFEASRVLGGMLRLGIPAFRLPRHILDADIAAVQALGVEIKTGMRLGVDITIDELLRESQGEACDEKQSGVEPPHSKEHDGHEGLGYGAVFIATGAYSGNRMGVPGEELEGVHVGLDFIQRANLGEAGAPGRRVAVIGGGNAAVDVARTAKRLGAGEVAILYRRTRHEMPADPLEVADAMREGVKVAFLVQPVRMVGANGRVTGVECQRMRLSDQKDASGRRRPEPIEGSEHVLPFDTVLIAIGQTPNTSYANDTIQTSKWGSIDVEPDTMRTSRPGVFAGGDVAVGAGTLVEAIAAGRRAAEAIVRYIDGEPMAEPKLATGVGGPRRPQWNEEDRLRFEAMIEDGGIALAERLTLHDRGFTEEEAKRETERCLNCGLCAECMECVKACKRGAVRHEQRDEHFDIEVGAILLTPGFDAFDAKIKGEFGFGRYPNVMTGLQFERVLSASGPTLGQITRPSDRAKPRSVAFVQCVGSRDTTCRNEYCSSVCCMASTKQAILIKEHEPDIDVAIFYIDLRAFGKDFDRYVERAKSLGVRYIRAIPSRLFELPGSRSLRLTYVDAAMKRAREEFDLVVLASALEPSDRLLQQAARLGIELNEWGFARTSRLAPMRTSRAGIFVAGAFEEPKDIPDSVVQASGAAAEAMALLARSRGALRKTRHYPPERNVGGQAARIGVFICHCGSNIASVVDVAGATDRIRQMPGVVHAEHTMYACADDSQAHLREMVLEHALNRVVVASCTPRTHEPIFRDTLREAGLNPALLEMANIRDQCSWVHANHREGANRKADDLIRMAVARAANLAPLSTETIAVKQAAVVVGGGLAGMTAALSLADQGFLVHLVEKSERLGGTLNELHTISEPGDASACVKDLSARVTSHARIRCHLGTTVTRVSGFVGNFKSLLRHTFGVHSFGVHSFGVPPLGGTKCGQEPPEGGTPNLRRPPKGGTPNEEPPKGGTTNFEPAEGGTPNEEWIEHGALIVATGATEMKPASYLYGKHPDVITQLELEGRLARNALGLPDSPSIVMIQCVEQRTAERPYCSRTCCASAVKNALALKRKYPRARIVVLYRDMRTYGFREAMYREAREAGVLFVRYEPDRAPEVKSREVVQVGNLSQPGREVVQVGNLSRPGLSVETFEPSLQRSVEFPADLVVLAAPTVPRADREQLSTLLRVPLNADGFFLEAHMKLRPVDFGSEGIFLCGATHAPKFANETIAQARAAAARAASILTRKRMPVGGQVSWVDSDKCVGCMTCRAICPYMAPRVGPDNKAEIQPAVCMGCGICAAECPALAIQLRHYTSDQVLAAVEELLALDTKEREAMAAEPAGVGVTPVRWTRKAKC